MNVKKTLPVIFILSLWLNVSCTSLFFYPMKQLILSPDKIGLSYENVYIKTNDGVRLHGWFLPSKKKTKVTLLFLHGNAENISTHIGAVYWLPRQNINVFLYDYRGYGKSEGELNIDTAISDVATVIEQLTKRKDVVNTKLIIYGQSLGAVIAVNAVAENQNRVSALILDSGFSDFRKIAREKLNESWITWAFQWPLSLTITGEHSPLAALREISGLPVLFIHGDSDRTIPLEHGNVLYNAASEPKTQWVVPNGRHTDAMTKKEYRKRLVRYIEQVPNINQAKPAD